MTPKEALQEKFRVKGAVPDICYGCAHGSGKIIPWFGKTCDIAIKTCQGRGFRKAFLPAKVRKVL